MENPYTVNTGEEKQNYKRGIIFIVMGIAIGTLITMQFKSSIPSSSYIYDEIKAQNELIDSYIADQSLLKAKIVSLRQEITTAQDGMKETTKDNNLDVLKSLKQELGLEESRGKGVLITLNDGAYVDRSNAASFSQSMINASDLRDIVNALRAAKVTAIAINDQRVIASTPITSVGTTIMVNNYHLSPPFSVIAIGDAELIMQRINDPMLLPDLIKRAKELKIQFKADANEHLTAPVYNGNLNVKLLKENTDTQA